MIPAHSAIYQTLSEEEASALWSRCIASRLLSGEPPERPDGPALGAALEDVSHAEVVLCVARETSPFWISLVGKLIRRPIYLCARGETGEALTDIYGRPLPLPIGHRIGEPPVSSAPVGQSRVKLPRGKIDHRIITSVAPNPKHSGSAAWQRYELYSVGMRVDEFVRLGGSMSDVRHDANRGFITLGMAEQES